MNHTQGEWKYSKQTHFQGGEPFSQSIYVTMSENTITIGCHQGDKNQEELLANAKLIAAAPENTQSNIYMTGAVQRCIEVLKEHVLPDSKLSDTDALLKIYGILDTPEMVDKLKISNAAIKKATE